MEDLSLNLDDDDTKINVGNILGYNTDNIELKTPGIDDLELLANTKNKSDATSDNGYSTGGEEDKKSDDYNFFKEKNEKSESKNIEVDVDEAPKRVPIDDPMINESRASEDNEFKPIHAMNSQEIKNEKIDLIYKFKKLENQGIRTTMNYNMSSHLEDMRNEFLKLKKQREVDNSIKFQRKVMMAAITGVEFLNNKFDPFDVKLDGWSESINENITDYDEIFEQLSEKYGGKGEMAPELKLLLMLGGSAFMFHLTNTMFKSSIPGMDDILKQNPDLMGQFAKAAVGSIGKTNNNNFSPPPMRNTNVNEQPQQSQDFRQEMDGPQSGLDDIINQMNLKPEDIPDLDNISLMSGDSGRRSNNSGITLNL
jgi:hypothetical protein